MGGNKEGQGKLLVRKVYEDAELPAYATQGSAGLDLYAHNAAGFESDTDPSMVPIKGFGSVLVGTGVAMAIPRGMAGFIFARSGLSAIKGLRPANCVGIVDSDYRGQVMVRLYNDTPMAQSIRLGDRIAQMVFIRYERLEVEEVEELDNTARGTGGFGSTGMGKEVRK